MKKIFTDYRIAWIMFLSIFLFGFSNHWNSLVDWSCGALTTIGVFHKKIHDGKAFEASVIDTDIDGDNTTNFIIFATGGNSPHLRISGNYSGAGYLRFYEDVEVGAISQTITATNLNRNSSDITNMQIYSADSNVNTLTAGSVLDAEYFGIGGIGNIGGTTESGNEIEIRQDTVYVLSVNTISANQKGSTKFEWYTR